MIKFNHLIKKSISFFLFGFVGITFSSIFFPLFLLIRPISKRNQVMRQFVSLSFRLFTNFMIAIRLITLDVENYKDFKSLSNGIVCPNHPSLLDVVLIIGMIPHADCVIKGKLLKNPFMKRIVKSLYIPNDGDPEETLERCLESLKKGRPLIIFPEGTRTPQTGETPKLKRSAAHLALLMEYPIFPVTIDVPQPTGIGKGDSFYDFPVNGKIEYTITLKNKLSSTPYSSFSRAIGARRMTEDLTELLFNGARKNG